MIIGLQITGILFSLIMIYFALLHFKKGHLNGIEISSWIIIWFTVILIVIFPEVIRVYAESFAVSRVLDLLIGGAFVVIFIMVGSVYVRTNRIEKKVEDLVRKIVLKQKR